MKAERIAICYFRKGLTTQIDNVTNNKWEISKH